MHFRVIIQSNSFRRRNDFVQRRGKETNHRSSPSLRFTDDEKDFFRSTVYFPCGFHFGAGDDDNYSLISFICCYMYICIYMCMYMYSYLVDPKLYNLFVSASASFPRALASVGGRFEEVFWRLSGSAGDDDGDGDGAGDDVNERFI